MTLRLPDDLDQEARVLAEREHRSLHGFIVNAVDEYVRRHGTDLAVEQIAAEGARTYADALDRLGRA